MVLSPDGVEPVRAAQDGRRGSRACRSASVCWEACGPPEATAEPRLSVVDPALGGLFIVLSPDGGRTGASCPGRQEQQTSLPVCQCVLGGLRTPEATAEPRLSVVDPALGRPVHEALAGRWPSRCELPRAAGGGAEPAGLPVRAGRPADSGGHGGATLVRSRSGAGEACSWCSRRAVAEPVRAAQGGRRGSRACRSASACWEACGLRRPRRSHACP